MNDGRTIARVALDFYRLLSAMERIERPDKQSSTAIAMRADYLLSLWEEISPHLVDNPVKYDNLEQRVHSVVQRANQIASELRKVEGDNLLDKLFFQSRETPRKPMSHEDDDSELQKNASKEDELDVREEKQSPSRPDTIIAQPNIQDLHKAQREQIEEAIAQMAEQLKNETSRIHSTLQSQTKELDEMEDVATDNVQKVTHVTKDVTDHVRKSWTRAIGTWTLIFTMVGVFLFCLVTIHLVPKRKGPCLFFCGKEQKKFCRTLPNGKQECIELEDFTQQSKRIEKRPKTQSTTQGAISDIPHETKDCEVDIYGACVEKAPTVDIVMPPAQEMRESALKDFYETKKAFDGKEDIQASATKMPSGEQSQPFIELTLASGSRTLQNKEVKDNNEVPIYQGKPFSPKNVREAAANGYTDLLKGYLSAKPEWGNKGDNNGWTPLHLAVRRVCEECVRILLDAGADPTAINAAGNSVIDVARRYMDPNDPIISLLEHAIHPKEEEEFTSDDVRDAAAKGDVERLKRYMVSNPEWGSFSDQNGWTPLHLAVRNGHLECVRVLLEVGSDTNIKTVFGHRPRDIAVDYHGEDHPIVSLFDKLTRQFHDDHSFSQEDIRLAVLNCDSAQLHRYLSVKPEWSSLPDQNGWTPLHESIRIGCESCVAVLLDAGADSQIRNVDGQLPNDIARNFLGNDHPILDRLEKVIVPMYDGFPFSTDDIRTAASQGNADRLKGFLSVKPEWVNAPDQNGWTPLHEAIRSACATCVEILLNAGADVNAHTLSGQSPRDIASLYHNHDQPILSLLDTHIL